MPALRASTVFGNVHPDLTVGAISCRRFAPNHRDGVTGDRDSESELLSAGALYRRLSSLRVFSHPAGEADWTVCFTFCLLPSPRR
jgi:hypothetical protein